MDDGVNVTPWQECNSLYKWADSRLGKVKYEHKNSFFYQYVWILDGISLFLIATLFIKNIL